MKRFEKSFTQQEPLPEAAIEAAARVMRSGRLHRYNTSAGELSEAALLERDYAAWQGASHCLACASGGQALQLAMRAVGVKPGDPVLANAWTLAPVPGAIHAVGARPVFVEIGADLRIDLEDLAAKAASSGAKVLMLSHMRGHIGRMEEIQAICCEHGIKIVEDCAHTMGARWNGRRSGNFGIVAAFSTQTYKHMNSGEGGLLTTNDPEIAGRATIMSGSYLLHARHGTPPPPEVMDRVELDNPNLSARMDELRATVLRVQLEGLEENVARWNARYRALEGALAAPGLATIPRPVEEEMVGSSIQFRAKCGMERIPDFISRCSSRGVDIKWFGAERAAGFTSRWVHWQYLGEAQPLPRTEAALAPLCDMRIPLSFEVEDCRLIGEIVADCMAETLAAAPRAAE